jgi:hypothetical protein
VGSKAVRRVAVSEPSLAGGRVWSHVTRDSAWTHALPFVFDLKLVCEVSRLHGMDREDLNSLQCRELTVIEEALQIEQAIFLVFRASSHF